MEMEKDKKYNIVLGLMIFFFILVVGISLAWGLSSIGKNDDKEDIKIENAKDDNESEKEEQYTITFDTDGGNEISKQKVTSGEKAIKPTNPSKDKYTFVEWQLDGKLFDFDTIIEEDITLVAKWKEAEKKQYTITFNTNGGTNVVAQKIEESAKANKPSNPTKNGYTFTNWTLDGKVFDFNTAITKDITLTANWKAVEKTKYTVSFNSNGGTAVSSQTIVDGNKANKPSNPTRNGYTFTGWTLNGSAFDFNTAITKNITLAAGWQSILDLTGRKCINQSSAYNSEYSFISAESNFYEINVRKENNKVYLKLLQGTAWNSLEHTLGWNTDYEIDIDASKVSQILVAGIGQDLWYPVIAFLMNDGSVMHLNAQSAVKGISFTAFGVDTSVKGVTKLAIASEAQYDFNGNFMGAGRTIVGIKADGSFYDLVNTGISDSVG